MKNKGTVEPAQKSFDTSTRAVPRKNFILLLSSFFLPPVWYTKAHFSIIANHFTQPMNIFIQTFHRPPGTNLKSLK